MADTIAESGMLFTELAPFLDLPVSTTGDMKIGDLAFASAEDKWSTAFFTTATSLIAAGSAASLFQTDIGQPGQGSGTNVMTISETNLKGGMRQPANQVYVATHLGFAFYYATQTSLAPIPINNPATIENLGLGLTWFLNVGDMIQRTMGTLIEYPAGSGAWGSAFAASGAATVTTAGWANNGEPSQIKRALKLPIVFPPNINVEIGLVSGSDIFCYDDYYAQGNVGTQFPTRAPSVAATRVGVRATFCGYRMTVPVK